MTSVRPLRCGACGGPVTYRAKFCAYCRAKLDFRTEPVLADRGRPACIFDLREGISPPGTRPYKDYYEPKKGIGFQMKVPDTRRALGATPPKLRDSIARLSAICHDPCGMIAVGARTHQIGAAWAGYFVTVWPARREVFARKEAMGKDTAFKDLLARQVVRELGGVGASNTLEVRCADSFFEVYVNGTKTLTFEDAHFSFGEHAWAVDAVGGTAIVTLQSFEVDEL